MRNFSIVWAIPLLALVVALAVAWRSYSERGPVITIEFEDGAGITPGQTELRYRDIRVGVVEELHFSTGLSSVIAFVRLDKRVAPYVDENASFWVVRPEVSLSGVSGLDTVISGVFIEGYWGSDIGEPKTRFEGLNSAPLYRTGVEGLEFSLRSYPGGMISGRTPILYQGVEVGRVGPARVSESGNFAIADAIIYEPHDRLVTLSTRFWDTSGFTVSVGPTGAEIDFSSVATLLAGGATFDNFVSGSEIAEDGAVFEIHSSETDARNSVFNRSEVESLELSVIFEDNVSGLALEAPVELNGLRVGSVEHLSGIVDPDVYGDSKVRLNVVLGIQPARLGLQGEQVTPEDALLFLEERVRDGLRARLASGNILTGGLKIELVEVPDAPPERMAMQQDMIPRLPTTDSQVSDTAATVEGVFNRINTLPFEELLRSAIGFLQGAQRLVSSDAIRGAPEELSGLLDDIRGVVTSQSVRDIPVTLNLAIGRLDAILAQIEEEQAVASVVAAIDATTAVATRIGTSVEGVPALVDRLVAVAAKAQVLPLEDLTEQVAEILASANTVISAPGVQELPGSLAAALDELNLTLSDLREGGAVTNVNATLSSAREAADAVALSTRDLPELVDRITTVFDQASATIEGYNRGDALSRDAQAALRDISEASRSVAALARLLERNPSVFIRGR